VAQHVSTHAASIKCTGSTETSLVSRTDQERCYMQ